MENRLGFNVGDIVRVKPNITKMPDYFHINMCSYLGGKRVFKIEDFVYHDWSDNTFAFSEAWYFSVEDIEHMDLDNRKVGTR